MSNSIQLQVALGAQKENCRKKALVNGPREETLFAGVMVIPAVLDPL